MGIYIGNCSLNVKSISHNLPSQYEIHVNQQLKLIYQKIADLGGIVPAEQTLENVAGAIATIIASKGLKFTGTVMRFHNENIGSSCSAFIVKSLDDSKRFSGDTFVKNNMTDIIYGDDVSSSGSLYDEHYSSPDKLSSVAFGTGMRVISDNAFAYSQIANIQIPDSVVSIGDNAFAYSQIASVQIPDSVISMGDNVFDNSRLSSVRLPSNLESIGVNAFSNTELTSVTIPNKTIRIDSAFSNSKNLVNVIPLNAFSVEHASNAFSYTDISSIDFIDGMSCIYDKMFQSCNSLTNANVPESIVQIGNMSFVECENLSSIDMSQSRVSSIGDFCFSSSRNLAVAYLPSSVLRIGVCAFYNAMSLSIYIPYDLAAIPIIYGKNDSNATFSKNTTIYVTANEMKQRLLTDSAWKTYEQQIFVNSIQFPTYLTEDQKKEMNAIASAIAFDRNFKYDENVLSDYGASKEYAEHIRSL